jgi:hypothetical protein
VVWRLACLTGEGPSRRRRCRGGSYGEHGGLLVKMDRPERGGCRVDWASEGNE